jgi:hypothetical protein
VSTEYFPGAAGPRRAAATGPRPLPVPQPGRRGLGATKALFVCGLKRAAIGPYFSASALTETAWRAGSPSDGAER